jgi:uncharacterized membrane protein
MASKAAITVNRPQEEVRRMWESSEYRPEYIERTDAAVTFKDAPGDRGTEIHVDLARATPGGRLGGAIKKLFGAAPLAKIKDDLRHFKQLVEAGEIARSDASPEGERAGRKLKQRPAQPLEESELQKVGV